MRLARAFIDAARFEAGRHRCVDHDSIRRIIAEGSGRRPVFEHRVRRNGIVQRAPDDIDTGCASRRGLVERHVALVAGIAQARIQRQPVGEVIGQLGKRSKGEKLLLVVEFEQHAVQIVAPQAAIVWRKIRAEARHPNRDQEVRIEEGVFLQDGRADQIAEALIVCRRITEFTEEIVQRDVAGGGLQIGTREVGIILLKHIDGTIAEDICQRAGADAPIDFRRDLALFSIVRRLGIVRQLPRIVPYPENGRRLAFVFPVETRDENFQIIRGLPKDARPGRQVFFFVQFLI